eukprot:GFYU01007406.1.p1 GENE.GFYU01007406.1~~GFYU01007406.1.p1  ORF type:complete len:372 (-),score=120.28 GFYU01007406.1:266-1381(-)
MSLNNLSIGLPITCHAWNADLSLLALCPNNNELHIYKNNNGTFEKDVVLKEHDQVISAIDWGHKTNRIVSCSHDRNAYVWNLVDGVWKPTLVILRINRAATSVKWSPEETKFAVGCGAKCVPICYFEEENDWWVSKIIKKHRSTVLNVDWHPCNTVIATGSSDYKCRIFSAQIKAVDGKKASPWGDKLTFGDLLHEFDQSRGWVHDVAWSLTGNTLCFAGHDSSLSFVKIGDGGAGDVQTLRTKDLPFVSVRFLSDTTVVAAGHDCNPKIFSLGSGAWEFADNVDKEDHDKKASKGGALSMIQKFQRADKMGQGQEESFDLKTLHQNSITNIEILPKQDAPYVKFSSSGLDGRIAFWDLKSIEGMMAKLKI